jgi:6,7-dimethyl-8-ribityllumazine synthase
MSTELKSLSDYNSTGVPNAENMRFGIVVAEWNSEITNALYEAAYNTLLKNGAKQDNIVSKKVPGSFELTSGAKYLAEYGKFDAIICLGCIIKGETPHFNYISHSVTHGITELNLKYTIPFIFGVLTTDNLRQARDRAGGKHGNKGDEAAVTAIKMAAIHNQMKKNK